jgi:septal ring factor EnvC (AmiA/AmiB activator)
MRTLWSCVTAALLCTDVAASAFAWNASSELRRDRAEAASGSGGGQAPSTTDALREQSERAERRIRALQAEADRLAARARTVFGDLRRLELDRTIKQEELQIAERALVRATTDRDTAARRLKALEATRVAETPAIAERLVELSKRGRAGYVQLVLASDDVRALGRMARGVAAVAELDRLRLEAHRRRLQAEKDTVAELNKHRAAAETLQKDAARAKAAVDAAVVARNRLIDDLDARRDLAAQYLAELTQAQSELERTLASADAPSAMVALPIRPFQGELPWPVAGKIVSRFGRVPAGRFGTSIVRNGIDVAVAEGTPVRAVHEGTVAFAAPFMGFSTLVIIDHGGSAFTMYGYLSEAAVTAGMPVTRGAEIGKAGLSPTGGPSVYFEVRIDGRPVDPLQWLKAGS